MPVLLVNRIVPRPDTTAPTAPTITASAASSSSISVALTTPSTDTQSGVASYRLEYKRTIDSTWTLDSASLTAGNFPRSVSGLVSGTSYDTRCRATDFAGNVGSFGATSQATTQGGETAPLWDGNVINIDIPIQAGVTRNLSDYIDSAESFEIIATERTPTQSALPFGVSMDSAGLITSNYSGSPAGFVCRVRAKKGLSTEATQIAAWWSTVTGLGSLINSQAFATEAAVRDISDTMSGIPARSQWDTSIKLFGNGSLRQDILDTDSYPGHPANWGARLEAAGGASAPGYSTGEPFTICCAIRVNRARIFNFAGTAGTKFYIVSTAPAVLGGADGGSSFQDYERVLDDANNVGYWRGVYSNLFTYWDQSIAAVSGSGVSPDIKRQPAIDRGAAFLNGTDPATGLAWTTWQQERARRGGLYSWDGGPNGNDNVVPDPLTGAVIFAIDQWTLIEEQINPGTPGQNNTYRRVRVAPLGQDWTIIYESSTEAMASDLTLHGGFTGVQFTNSSTGLTAQAGVRATPASQWMDALNIHAGLVNLPAIGF